MTRGAANPGCRRVSARRPAGWNSRTHLPVICALTFAVYAGGLWNGFVTDDESEVLQDHLIRSFAFIPRLFAHGVWHFAGATSENYYRPLKLLAYSAEYHLFGFRVAWWHLASIVLEMAVATVVYLLVRDLASRRLAFWTAVWFALLPVHVEAVAWVAGGQDLLCAMALVAATWAYHRGRSGARPRLHYGLSAGLFFAALLAKEAALTFPAVILAYDFCYRGESLRELLRSWRRYVSYSGVLGVYLGLRVHALRGFAPSTSGMHLTVPEMIWSVPVLALKYVWLALVPAGLNYWHMYIPERAFGWRPLAAMGVVAALAAVPFRLRRIQPAPAFALAWFWITLVPVLAIPKVSGNVFTERYLYIPSFGFCVLAAWAWLRLRDQASRRMTRCAACAGLAAIFAWYSILIVRRLPDWHDTLTLTEKTARQSPDSPQAAGALGYIYFQRGRYADALTWERRAAELDPRLASSWMNLGAIYNARQEWQESIAACRRGLALEPDNSRLLNQAGLALWQNGERDPALDHWRRAVRLDPADLEARMNFATSLYQLGRLDAAIEQLTSGLRASQGAYAPPDSPDAYLAHFKLGYFLEQKGAWEAAEREYGQTLELQPNFTAARGQLEELRGRVDNLRSVN